MLAFEFEMGLFPAVLDEAKRKRQMEALERVLSAPKWDVTINGHMPTADERNARR